MTPAIVSTAAGLTAAGYNKTENALSLYFPQALQWTGTDLGTPMACDWLLKWPTLDAVQRARPQTVRAFYYAHNCRSAVHVESVLAALPAAKPLTQDAAVLAVQPLTVQMLAKQLRLLHGSIAEYNRQIAALFKPHPDAFLFECLPGAGPTLAPRLLSAFGTDRARHPTAQDMQTYAGVAPVIERSGKSGWTHWRWNCPKFLRQTFHEYAKNSIQYSAWARAYYEQQKQRGKGHNAAIRSLAFKWVRIIHRCWQTRTPYVEGLYLQALAPRGSPLVALLAAPAREA